jgi:hypothetical protein
MSFPGMGGAESRLGYAKCLQCNKHTASAYDLLMFGYPTKAKRMAWRCPSCHIASYIDSMVAKMFYLDSDNEESENEVEVGEKPRSKDSSSPSTTVSLTRLILSVSRC